MILAIVCATVLGGCGSSGVSQEEYNKVVAERDALKNESQESDNSTASANESEEIPDLSGNWEQEGKGESYQAGYISDDVIEIYWITDDSKALYWSGSYEAPTEKTDSFSWESKSDKEKTSTALLASLDDSKIFTYDSGKISYEVTAQGVAQTIKMIPTDTDYSDNQTKASGDDKEHTEGKAQLAIPESATNGMWVNSYVDIQQKDGKYETKIYLDSVDATDAERLYFTAGVIMELMDREVESGFCVITPSGEYKMNTGANGFEDMGLPKEWLIFFENGENGIQSVRNNISVAFSDSFENWKKYTFDKYLDDVIIVEEESGTESASEETELNVITSGKYKVDGQDVGMVLSETDELLDISIIGHANTEEKASIMLATYINELEKLTSLDSYSVCAFCEEQFATYSKDSDGKTNTYGTNSDGSIAFSSPDWLKTEITMPEDEANLYISDLLEKLTEFSESMSSDSADSKGETETETQEKSSELQENDSENPYWTYSGSGDDIVTGFNSTKSFSIAHIVNDGNGHFAVKAHYDNKYDLLVNTTELYDGMTLIYPQKEYTFEITGRGDWKIEVYEMGVSTAEEFSGNGDFVTPIFLKNTDVYEISAKGKGHFAVKGWTDNGYQLLVNTTDEDYSGKVMFKDKEKYAFFEITASGEWRISPVK
mgnify:FL=1